MKGISVILAVLISATVRLPAEKLLRELKIDLSPGSRVVSLYVENGHIVCSAVENPEDFSTASERVFVDGIAYGPFVRYRFHGFAPDGERPVFHVRERGGSYLRIGNAEIRKPGNLEYWTWNADGTEICTVFSSDGGWFVHTPGGMFGPYDEIPPYGMPRYLGAEKLPSYISRRGEEYFLHRNGHAAGPFVDVREPEYSPDGKSFAAAVETGSGFMIVTDTGALGPFEMVDRIAWSKNGKTLVRSVMENGEYFLYAGTAKRGPFRLPPEFTFNADGTVTCAENLADKAWLFTGKTRIGPFEYVGGPIASPDGKTVAYPVRQKGKYYLKHGAASYGPYDEIGTYRFYPDGKTLAFSAEKNGNWAAYSGKAQLGSFTEPVEEFLFSSDGKRVSFVAKKSDGLYAYAEGRENGPFEEAFFVRDDRGGGRKIVRPTAYAARTGDSWYFYTGAEKLGPFSGPSAAWDFSVSENGKILVYCAETEEGTFLMKGREAMGAYENPGYTEVSPDGRITALNFSRTDRFHDVLIRNGKEFPGSFTHAPSGAVTGYVVFERGAIRLYAY